MKLTVETVKQSILVNLNGHWNNSQIDEHQAPANKCGSEENEIVKKFLGEKSHL